MKQTLYYNASKLIAEKEYVFSCVALAVCIFTEGSKKRNLQIDLLYKYEYFFEHHIKEANSWWGNGDFSEESQLCRSLALLFMHEMYVRGEL